MKIPAHRGPRDQHAGKAVPVHRGDLVEVLRMMNEVTKNEISDERVRGLFISLQEVRWSHGSWEVG